MSKNIISTISKNYANALIDTVSDSVETVRNQFKEITETIKNSPDLNIVMNNDSISVEKKLEIIESAFKGKIDERLLNFLKILIENKRFGEINSIFYAYEQVLDNSSNRKNVEIISSIELNDELKNKIINKLQEKLNCEIIPDWRVDDEIIAGLEFRFDDYIIDTSVRTKLKKIGENI